MFGRIINDYSGGRRLTTQETRPVAGPVLRQRVLITPTGGLTETNGAQNPANPGAIATVANDLRAQPERLILAALDNPSLQITAWRRKQQVEVGVQVSGNAKSPRIQLVSNPPVPEGERLSWLVLGRAPGEATKGDLGILQAAAGALLANNEGVPLDRQIARRFGLDEISLRGTGEVQDRVVAVGKRLSDRLYISYEQGLGATASQLVKLDFSLTYRIALRAETGTSSGGGILFRYSWD